MAIKHVRAAQDFAVTTDQLGRHILITIAMDIGHNNEDAYPSIRTIARRVGCHYNTVASWVKTLAECGDLIVTKRGKRQYYNIPFVTTEEESSQLDYDKHYDSGCDKQYDNDSDNVLKIVTALSQQVEKLSQQVEKLSQPDYDRSIEDIEVIEDINNNDFPSPASVYENEIGLLTPVIADSIQTAVTQFGPTWVIDAIGIASRAGSEKRNWRYINGILGNWSVNGKQDIPRAPNGNGATESESLEDIIDKALSEVV